MPKLTPLEKIAKLDAAIEKEVLAIETSKERIKTLKAEKRKAESEQEQSFAIEVMKLLRTKGITQDAAMKLLNAAAPEQTSAAPEDPVSSSPDDATAPDTPSGFTTPGYRPD